MNALGPKMDILGPDEITLTCEDLDEGRRFLTAYSLLEVETGAAGSTFRARDGTGIKIRHVDAPGLPAAVVSGPNIREAVWGVADKDAIDRIGAELSKDRQVTQGPDGVLRSTDFDGNAMAFQVTQRHAFDAKPSLVNVPGLPPLRGLNQLADFSTDIQLSTFSHLGYWTDDLEGATEFYEQRLGFRLTDVFTGSGSFMRTDGHPDHHNLLIVKRGDKTKGFHHVAFHARDHLEMAMGGKRMEENGYRTSWGPGRHIFGGNHFWYFKSPFGGNVEIDADMDIVNDAWEPRHALQSKATASIYLNHPIFEY